MRHGMTDWNALHKLQGQKDIPLNEEGLSMARAAHDEYLNTHFDICFSSPLKRALETARILFQGRDVPIMTDDRLMEMSFGEYEGLQDSFLIPDCPINVLFKDPGSYKESIGGAETFAELFSRADSFLTETVFPELQKRKDILIVGHKGLNSAIISQIKQIPISQFWNNGVEQCKLMRLI